MEGSQIFPNRSCYKRFRYVLSGFSDIFSLQRKMKNYKLTRTKLHNYKYLIFSDDYEEDNKLEEEKPSEYVRFFIILLELRIEC